MKKLIAMLLVVSFMTVNTAGAFAEQRGVPARRSGRSEENRQSRPAPNRRHEANRPAPNRRPVVNRPAPNHRHEANRPGHDRRPVISRPAPDRRPVVIRPNNNLHRRQAMATRHHNSFFNRVGRSPYRHRPAPYPAYRHRPAPYSAYQPNYHYHGRRSSSLTPLEFFGIGAAIIAMAAMVNNASYYDY